MGDRILTRRRLLKGGATLAVGGFAFTQLPSLVVKAMFAPGVSRTLAVEPPTYNPSTSHVVDLDAVEDPTGDGRDQVIHVTSGGTETTHYAFSIASVRRQQLRVRDIDSLRYDYYVPSGETNTVGTDPAISPDEVWLIVRIPGHGREELFRTWPIQSRHQFEAGRWHTRTVEAEFTDLSISPWKRLDEDAAKFEVVGPDLLEDYGDARLVGVGVGRGDPKMGPSKLDVYYDELELNGRRYAFPA